VLQSTRTEEETCLRACVRAANARLRSQFKRPAAGLVRRCIREKRSP